MIELERFIVEHAGCGGEYQWAEPTEADLIPDGIWQSVKCGGCGATARALRSYAEIFASAISFTGLTAQELREAVQTPEGFARVKHLVETSPEFAAACLASIRRGQGTAPSN